MCIHSVSSKKERERDAHSQSLPQVCWVIPEHSKNCAAAGPAAGNGNTAGLCGGGNMYEFVEFGVFEGSEGLDIQT